MSDGQHITLDYIGWQSPEENEGEWMLALLREAVLVAGAREVHSHVEPFDGSLSPLGFAAVVLIDESHVSAHCYSERGLLAIDAFTCGTTDADAIADHVHAALSAAIPQIQLVRRSSLDRFVNW